MKTISKLSLSILCIVLLQKILTKLFENTELSKIQEKKLILKLYNNEKANEIASNFEKQGLC
jgi:hypothetical protein